MISQHFLSSKEAAEKNEKLTLSRGVPLSDRGYLLAIIFGLTNFVMPLHG